MTHYSQSRRRRLIEQIESVYGRYWKKPLAEDLEVSPETIGRLFNQPKKLPKLYVLAIKTALKLKSEERKNDRKVQP